MSCILAMDANLYNLVLRNSHFAPVAYPLVQWRLGGATLFSSLSTNLEAKWKHLVLSQYKISFGSASIDCCDSEQFHGRDKVTYVRTELKKSIPVNWTLNPFQARGFNCILNFLLSRFKRLTFITHFLRICLAPLGLCFKLPHLRLHFALMLKKICLLTEIMWLQC